MEGISLTAKVFAGSKYFCTKEMLNNSIHHVSFHCPSSIDNLHQSLDAFYKQVYLQVQCLTKQRP